MFKKPLVFTLIFISISFVGYSSYQKSKNTGAPPYVTEDLSPPENGLPSYLVNWKRPDGPPKVALQAGHWKAEEVPEELKRLRDNTGSSGGGKWEWELNLEIAEETAKILREKGIEVDILPATIPPRHWADAFVAIHADGSLDTGKSGYKIASPRRDYSGNSITLKELLYEEYDKSTHLIRDKNISRNMRGYYAFAWWRYNHALHPMTPAVILETGFLTSPSDRKVLFDTYIPASGIASGIIEYLESEKLLNEENT